MLSRRLSPKGTGSLNKVLRYLALSLLLSSPLGFAAQTSPQDSPQTKQSIASDNDCNVSADPSKAQYIIGYGSLMEEQSKNRRTSTAKQSYPLRIHDFERGWIKDGSLYSQTNFLGVIHKEDATLNGVIYNVTAKGVADTDSTERGYCRVQVQPEKFELLSGNIEPDSQVWIYLVADKDVKYPSQQYPIVQSYVDLFLKGCLEIESQYSIPGFTKECVTTTKHWSSHWLNDRIFPRRPFIHEPKSLQIDQLLLQQVPEYLEHRRLPE